MNKNYKKIGIVLGLVFILIVLGNPMITPFHASNPAITPFQAREYQLLGVPHPPPNLLQYLQQGDIIFMDSAINGNIYEIKNFPAEGINSNDHCALFVGYNPDDPNNNNDWCIHAGDPVQYARLYGAGGLASTHVNFSIYRVANATLDQIIDVTRWERDRVIQGCHWQNIALNINKDWDNVYDPSFPFVKNRFYCTELHWAAYYNTTWWAHQADPSKPIIDIDNNGFSIVPYDTHPCVNIGIAVAVEPIWILRWILNGEYPEYYNYAKRCEIKIDGDMQKIYPVS